MNFLDTSITLLSTKYYCSDLGEIKFTDFHFGNMIGIVKSKRLKYINTTLFLMFVHAQNLPSLLTNNKNVENMYIVHQHGSNIQTMVLPAICTSPTSQELHRKYIQHVVTKDSCNSTQRN
jgi:hypothetical protein